MSSIDMCAPENTGRQPKLIERAGVGRLIAALQQQGYRVVGPTVRDEAIIYDELASDADLPAGWTDDQQAGAYRLKRRRDQALFRYTCGPHSWKKYLHPPQATLWRAEREGGLFRILPETPRAERLALLGVRACELRALAIQEQVFAMAAHADAGYGVRLRQAFVVAVNCGQAGGTCFCVSMNSGPRARKGFDLALTEVVHAKRHYFVVEIGSERGAAILAALETRDATAEEIAAAEKTVNDAARHMGRTLDTTEIQALLYRNHEHPRWEQTGERCLSCANCTLACPTCFCSTIDDTTDLAGQRAERTRRWDSCFTADFSYIHGGSVRQSVKARYRQWLTHKLASWIEQFGSSGCVGCGRCITWCPVGIDLTEEVRAIRATKYYREPVHGDTGTRSV